MTENIEAYSSEITVHIPVCITKNCKAYRTKIIISFNILLVMLFLIMLCTVKLDDCFSFCTVEIYDIITDNLLSVNSNIQCFQKVIP